MLYEKDFRYDAHLQGGCSGHLLRMTSKKNPNLTYIIKNYPSYHSYNEYVGQHLISALGYDAVPAKLMLFSTGCLGAIQYLPNLQRLHPRNTGRLSPNQKRKFVGLFVLNTLINNPDEGEIYLTPEGKVVCLDLADTLHGINPQYFPFHYDTGVRCCLGDMPETGSFSKDDMINAALDLLFALDNLDMDLMHPYLRNIEHAVSPFVAKTFESELRKLKQCAQNEWKRLTS